MPTPAFIALLGASVGLFLVYNGLLWKAPREASHVARFAVSYLAVVPLAALLLLALRRFSWAHLVTSTGAVWAIKLVITAALYQAFARGTAAQLRAVAPPATALTASAPARDDYRAAASFASGVLRGHVRRAGEGLPGAVVFLDAPAPGRAPPPPQRVELVVSDSRYAEPLYVAHVDDEIFLVNRDGVLHTAHLSGAGTMRPSRPMPPSAGPQRLPLAERGLYHVRCDNHPGEATSILIVDHPYVVRSGGDGAFVVEGAPVGEVRLVAVAATGAAVRTAAVRAVVRAAESTEVSVDLDQVPGI